MELKQCLAAITLLNLPLLSLADSLDDHMDAAMDELDRETGSCIPELQAQTLRANKLQSALNACDVSAFSQKVENLQTSNTRLKTNNTQLHQQIKALNADDNAQENDLIRANTELKHSKQALLITEQQNKHLSQQLILLKNKLAKSELNASIGDVTSVDSAHDNSASCSHDLDKDSQNYVTGAYKDSLGTTYMLEGPSLMPDSRKIWSLMSDSYSFSLRWTGGENQGHPDIQANSSIDSEEAKRLASGYSYGTVGDAEVNNSHVSFGHSWDNGDLIGAQQIGNNLTLTLFNSSAGIQEVITLRGVN